jgi:hypothetical protein
MTSTRDAEKNLRAAEALARMEEERFEFAVDGGEDECEILRLRERAKKAEVRVRLARRALRQVREAVEGEYPTLRAAREDGVTMLTAA